MHLCELVDVRARGHARALMGHDACIAQGRDGGSAAAQRQENKVRPGGERAQETRLVARGEGCKVAGGTGRGGVGRGRHQARGGKEGGVSAKRAADKVVAAVVVVVVVVGGGGGRYATKQRGGPGCSWVEKGRVGGG